jgi:hypothetical protein
MGKSILTFDQIEILTKKSDASHSDNDWLFITWFVNDQLIRTDNIPLVNQSGSQILESGDHLLPVSSEVICSDTDLVTASFVVMNLGSYDWNEQIEAAGKIAANLAEGLAGIYLAAVQLVIANSGLPAAQVFAAGIEELTPVIVDSAGAFIEDVFIPGLQEMVSGILQILDRPNCNGPVFHDLAVFKPRQPEPSITLWKTYTANSMSGCGSPAKTSTHFTLDRDLDFVPQFPNTPPPQYGVAPSVNESPDNWLGMWAEDPLLPFPLIHVSIAHSLMASGLFTISITEKIDPRFNLIFETKADPISPRSGLQLKPYVKNVPGTIQPWSSHPVSPGGLQVFAAKLSSDISSFSAADTRHLNLENPPPPEPLIALTWKRPFKAGIPLTIDKGSVAETFVPGGFETALFFEIVDGFYLKDRDITLAFYNVLANGQVVGRALRYLRGATTAYTRADWMLARWKPAF